MRAKGFILPIRPELDQVFKAGSAQEPTARMQSREAMHDRKVGKAQ